ncbi:hypothetical protein BDF19DRAFT_410466 [Syncephalis fuscata]|nr:hypothetical protein BDF19DRAFT_410466 [Syncephalis fuscata]
MYLLPSDTPLASDASSDEDEYLSTDEVSDLEAMEASLGATAFATASGGHLRHGSDGDLPLSPTSEGFTERSYELIDALQQNSQVPMSSGFISGICDTLESLDHRDPATCLEMLHSLPLSDSEGKAPMSTSSASTAATGNNTQASQIESRLRLAVRRSLQRQMYLQAELDRYRAASMNSTTSCSISTDDKACTLVPESNEQREEENTSSKEEEEEEEEGDDDVEDTIKTSTSATSSIDNLSSCCIRECTRVAQAVMLGDLTQRIHCGCNSSTMTDLKTVMNGMVGRLHSFTADVVRFALENSVQGRLGVQMAGDHQKGDWLDIIKRLMLCHLIIQNRCVILLNGTEGMLGVQAKVDGVGGTWKLLTDNVNTMASNLTAQVRDIANVSKAVAQGDLSRKVTVDVKGEFLELKNTINTMVDQLQTFAMEVTRVSLEVGTEGKLGGQAVVKDVGGTWKDLTDNVNLMASNLTGQVRDIATVCKAVACGDLSRKITVRSRGEILDLKVTINTMVDQLRTFAAEVTRVSREVGTEGKLGGQAEVKGVGGTWKELTDNVNLMASNLTDQVRDIANVSKAVARGDLSKKITVNVKGEILDLKNTSIPWWTSCRPLQLNRYRRQTWWPAVVKDAAGTWKDLTDNVNTMAANLTSQVRSIATVTMAVARGDLSKKIVVDVKGEILDLKTTVNSMVDQLRTFAAEVTRVSREVGTEGKLGGQAVVKDVNGTWKELTDNVNQMASNLTAQVRDIANVSKAVARGDLSKKITVDSKGEILELKNTINTMVDQLQTFAMEVTRVSLEVGTEGKLGGQAVVKDVSGTWKDLTDNVNTMAANLTSQVRSIATVTMAVARGDLSKKIVVDVKGEILDLKTTVNSMVDQLRTFAAEVTRVAREVGTEGKLGGQAVVKDVGGTWKDLTDNVNQMASNLTAQVRDIANVSKAVARGDLSKQITVDSKGEILELKNTINTMVDQLQTFAMEVTRCVKDAAGTWKDLTDNVNTMAANLTSQVRSIANVTMAVARGDLSKKITVNVKGEILDLKTTVNSMVDQLRTFGAEVTRVAREVGTEGKLGGQAVVKDVSGTWKDLTDNVNLMASNLTSQKITVDSKGEILDLKNTINTMVDQLRTFAIEVTRVAREVGTEGRLGVQAEVHGVEGTWKGLTEAVNTMAANLTSQVRAFAQISASATDGDFTRFITVEASGEMDSLKTKINQMVYNLRESIQKNTAAREAAEWPIVPRIRTPMNGIIGMTALTLETELTRQQRENLMIVSSLANTLLTIIDDILDISKIEANKLVIEQTPFSLRMAVFGVLKSLTVKANQKKLDLIYDVDKDIPDQLIGDPLRVRQVITNLIGNAIKFTNEGRVVLQARAREISHDKVVLVFCVHDTGIGIESSKVNLIFDTFCQADGSTTRKFGGTGLGLSISKRLVSLMGGQLWVRSTFGEGSQFYFTVEFQPGEMTYDQVLKRISPYKSRSILLLSTISVPVWDRLVEMLEALSLRPVPAVTVEEAAALTTPPKRKTGPMFDAVIVDDLGVVEKLREVASLRYVPIVLLVLGEPRMKMKTCIDLGIASYVHAPLRYPDVMNALLPAMESHVVLPDSSGQPRTRLHILLAEDNIVNQKLAVRILEKFGHRVSIVSNGQMAVEAVQKDSYDLILMDVQMPIMGGFEATQRIREWERCTEVIHPIPIIALTAHAMIGDREKCMAAGMDEYITKPLRFNELIATINKFVVKIENGMSAEHHGVV